MPLPPDDSGLAPADLATLCAFPAYSTTFNVKSAPYSAVGDGVADDTAAIEAAITAAIAFGGHCFVYFPTGTYAVCRQTDTHDTDLYQQIFELDHGGRDFSNICFIGDGPTLSKLIGYMPSLGSPSSDYQTSTLGSPNPQMSRFVMFFANQRGPSSSPYTNVQFRSLKIDGQVGYTGDFTVGGSRKLATVAIATAGTGYHVGDILTPVPTGGFPLVTGFETDTAQIRVTTIGGGGNVTGVALDYGGRYGYISGGTIDVTGGFGTGFQFTFTKALTGDGWDQLHKAIFLFRTDNCLIYNCDLANWKGEILFGGSNGDHNMVLTSVRGSNSSAISNGANQFISDCVIGGTGTTADLVLNGTENFAFDSSQGTTVQRTSTRTGGGVGNGLVHLGVPGSHFTVDHCDAYQRILLSEAAYNVSITNTTFHECGFSTSNLGLYPESTGFADVTLDTCTHIGKSDASGQLLGIQNGISTAFDVQNCIIQGNGQPTYILGGGIFQPGAVFTNNTPTNGAIDISGGLTLDYIPLWTRTRHPAGVTSMGYTLSTNGNGDTSTIFPPTDYTGLFSDNTNTHYIQIDDTQMSKYPDGFQTHFRLNPNQPGINFTLKKNSAWNAFANDVPLSYDDLCIRLNVSRKFEVVVLPLLAGTVTAPGVGGTTASVSYGIVIEGVPPYSNQLQRSLTSGSGFSNVGSPQAGSSFSLLDTGLSLATNYFYRVVTTDNVSTSVTSAELHIKTGSLAVDLLTGLAAYYKFDESSGNAADATGNGHTLTNTAGTFAATNAIINNGYVVVSANSASATDNGHAIMSGSKTKISYAGWAYRSAASNKMTVGYWDTSGIGPAFALYTGATSYVATDSALAAYAAFTNTDFPALISGLHHCAIVYDGTQSTASNRLKFYFDGVLLTPSTSAGTFPTSLTITGDFTFGNVLGSPVCDGEYDEWAIYDGVALDASQVAALYNTGTGLQWPFSAVSAGTLAQTAVTTTTASLSYGTVSSGLAPYSNQLRRSLTSGSGYSNVGSPQVGATASFSDTGLSPSTDYYYIVVTTDNASQTATSNEVHVTTSAAAVVTTHLSFWRRPLRQLRRVLR